MKKLFQNNVPLLCALLLLLAYLCWVLWVQPKQTPTDGFVTPPQAVPGGKVPGPTIKPPVKIIPKPAVKKKFPEAQIANDEEWVDSAEVPPAPNGAVVLTKIDTITGDVTTQIENKKAPWLAFESTNYIGVGVEFHPGGEQDGKLYYKRDLLRVKDIHLQGAVQGKINRTLDKGAAFIGANLELRF